MRVDTALPTAGQGFVNYRREAGGADQYGTAAAIAALLSIARAWHQHSPKVPFSVGDISREGGGKFPPHASHRDGRDADIRPLRADGQNLPVEWDDAEYSRALTRALCRLIRRHANVEFIYFNDPHLIKEGLTRWCPGHDNHLHVRFKQ